MTDGYNQTYGAEETSEVSIDLVVGILDELFNFVTLIALIILAGWLAKRVQRFR